MFELRKKKTMLLALAAVSVAWVGMMGMLFLSDAPIAGTALIDSAFQLVSCDPYYTIIEGVKASVVTITASGKGPRSGAPDTSPSNMNLDIPWNAQTDTRMGCGLIIDSSGYILTNLHLVEDATKIEVQVYRSEDKTYTGKTVASDASANLALLKIEPSYPLPEATLGNSDLIEAGDVVMAIGSPFGFEYSVTRGIVSDERRTITINDMELTEMIHTDAAINRGNSGGPLIDSNGIVIGINTAILTPTGVYVGLSFAVPINKARKLLITQKYSGV
ncbi:trypsin-like peptidase domain-containing protein [Candidatus Hydrogenedentota bacterium]